MFKRIVFTHRVPVAYMCLFVNARKSNGVVQIFDDIDKIIPTEDRKVLVVVAIKGGITEATEMYESFCGKNAKYTVRSTRDKAAYMLSLVDENCRVFVDASILATKTKQARSKRVSSSS